MIERESWEGEAIKYWGRSWKREEIGTETEGMEVIRMLWVEGYRIWKMLE